MAITKSIFIFVTIVVFSLLIYSGEELLAWMLFISDLVIFSYILDGFPKMKIQRVNKIYFLVLFPVLLVITHILFRGHLGWVDYSDNGRTGDDLFSSNGEYILVFTGILITSLVLYRRVRGYK